MKYHIQCLLILCAFSCEFVKKKTPPNESRVFIDGVTMGTTYHITYFDRKQRNFKRSVDSLLDVLNKSINTWDTTSEVSEFNSSTQGIKIQLPYLIPLLEKSAEVNRKSSGAFDPTVMPLINAWGFGADQSGGKKIPNIDSLKKMVGFEKISFTGSQIKKSGVGVQLDFGGIGQGYGVDVIVSFLRSKGIINMLVEIGGEGMATGRNIKKKSPWTIGILDPNSTRDEQFFKAYVNLEDRSFTTSGNYFNYKIIDNRKYGHTIDPHSGYPVQHSLLSASVFASDCATADAWATAFMVMGLERSMALLPSLPELEVIFIYSSEDNSQKIYISPSLAPHVLIEK